MSAFGPAAAGSWPDKLRQTTPPGCQANSCNVAASPDGIAKRAIFSARVTNAEYLQEIDDVVRRYVNGEIDLATARLQLKQKLQEIGYRPDTEEA